MHTPLAKMLPHAIVRTLAAAPAPSRSAPLLWLAATQLIALLSLAPWALITGFAFVSRSGAVLLPGVLRYLAWVYPLLPFGCTWASWRAYARGDVPRALRFSSLPLTLAIPLLLYIWYMASPVN